METAKERVQKELEELNDKIVKLAKFLYSESITNSSLSGTMVSLMKKQLYAMQDYANILIERLSIWGKKDAELKNRLHTII